MKDIYDLLTFLDKEKDRIDIEYGDRECGPYLSYEIIADNEIQISFGFSDYEEFSDYNLNVVIFGLMCNVTGHNKYYYCECENDGDNYNEINKTLTIDEFVKNYFE